MILSLLLINYINTFNNVSDLTTSYINLYHPSIDKIKYTNYSIEKIFNENSIHFSQLNYNCKNYIEKNKAKSCLEYNPTNWWCIYDNCISQYRRNNLLLIK
jgi:hypothetical protein